MERSREAKPLSFIKYLKSNVKRTVAMILALVFSVFMVIIFQMVFYVVKESGRLAQLGRIGHVTEVYPSGQGYVSNGAVEKILTADGLEKSVHVAVQTTEYYHFFTVINIPVYTLPSEDMEYVMDRLGMTLKEGRMPKAGENEMLLDWRVMNNQGKKLGAYVGREADPKEAMPGKYKIVGVLDGDCFLGMIPVKAGAVSNSNGMLLFAKPGMSDTLDASVSAIPEDDAFVVTKAYAEQMAAENTDMINKLTGIASLAILFVMSFASGNSSYAHYFSRRYEFGMLQAVGYTRGQVLIRAAKEIALMSFVGFAGGILLGMGAGALLNQAYFEPHGFPFVLLTLDKFVAVIVIPISTALFGIIPVGLLMTKIDPLTVIEKFE